MRRNAFYCPHCQEYTNHIALPADEVSAMQGSNSFVQLSCRLGDFLGGWSIAKLITGMNFWKCSKCGLGTSRKADGSIHECFQNGKRWEP